MLTSKTSGVVSGAAHHVGLKEQKFLALHFMLSKGYHWLITKKIGHVLFFLSINFFFLSTLSTFINNLIVLGSKSQLFEFIIFFYSDCISTTDLSFHGQVLS